MAADRRLRSPDRHRPDRHWGGDSGEQLALERVLPTYDQRCITAAIPELLADAELGLIDDATRNAPTVVLFLIDGLGTNQLMRSRHAAPSLAAAAEAAPPVTTVAPSTTAAALTSLTTGATPGEHGLISYRLPTPYGRLNSLRWRAGGEDARPLVPPHEVQPVLPFCGQRVAVVSRNEFRGSGFSAAHLRGSVLYGWKKPKQIARQVMAAVEDGHRLVFAYYDTLDKTAHEFGLSERYERELANVDRLAAELRDRLAKRVPAVPILFTADHGVVNVADPAVLVDPEVVGLTSGWSGEARMLWLHAREDASSAAAELADACQRYAPIAEVATLEQVEAEGWFGPVLTQAARGRLGDVVLVPTGLTAFKMPDEEPPKHPLIGRHGGLTAEEMMVPFARL